MNAKRKLAKENGSRGERQGPFWCKTKKTRINRLKVHGKRPPEEATLGEKKPFHCNKNKNEDEKMENK